MAEQTITEELARLQRSQRQAEALKAGMLVAALDAIVTMDGEGRVIEVNPAAERLFGRLAADMVGQDLAELVIPARLRAAHRAGLQRLRSPDVPFSGRRMETVAQHADGREIPVELTITRVAVEPVLFTGYVRDVSARLEAETRLRRQARTDSLTGLANRARLIEELDACHTDDAAPSLLFLDLDRFKVINNSVGHVTGDAVLTGAADRLRHLVDDHDLVVRTGGDEFSVLLTGPTAATRAVALARSIVRAFRRPLKALGAAYTVTPSVGVSHARLGWDPVGLLREADVSMYEAKTSRSGYAVFDAELHSRLVRRMQVEIGLAEAIAADSLEVVYQPIVRLSDGALIGAEALARFRHPTLGVVPPAEFIAVAEESGQIGALGRAVLEKAVRQLAAWRARDPETGLTMSVNLSARQLVTQVVDDVERLLIQTGLPPSSLCLELTETALMDDPEATLDALGQLRALGVLLAIDDFGTGYCSLAYLKRFPVHVLKIDRSFIQRIDQDPTDRAIVDSIVGLARALGLRVVAEGIEAPEQAGHALALGCTLAQGYLYGRPARARELEVRLRSPRARIA